MEDTVMSRGGGGGEGEASKRIASVIKMSEVRKINPALATFYSQEMSRRRAASSRSRPMLPVIHIGDANAKKTKKTNRSLADSEVRPLAIKIGNSCKVVKESFDWTAGVWPCYWKAAIKAVTFHLHPTFTPSVVRVTEAPFAIHRRGWGTFPIRIQVELIDKSVHTFTHNLCFNGEGSYKEHIVSVKASVLSDDEKEAKDDDEEAAVGPSGAQGCEDDDDEEEEEESVANRQTMEGVPESEMHGRMGVGKGWAIPTLLTFCDVDARPGYKSMKAHEYADTPRTLRLKIALMAQLIRRAQHCVAYTGAGISTSSGIDDYASKSKQSVATGSNAHGRVKKRTGLDAEPTFAHFTLAALHKQGQLVHWVQQNHDGLPQKAGFPTECLNEIHGAWFDPSNPVVPMSGSLRGDLMKWMVQEEEAADLVLTMGTSLCGMNADRMVDTPSEKHKKGKGLGSIIINFQRTQMDECASLRIFAPIDQVMLLLALEMALPVSCAAYSPSIPNSARVANKPHAFMVPYSAKDGKRSKGKNPKLIMWDLSVGAKIKLTEGPGKSFEGVIARVPGGGDKTSYTVRVPCTREGAGLGQGMHSYAMGAWWVEAACKGTAPLLPVINL